MALTKVTKTGITDNAIDGDKIEDGTVVAADIAPGTISSDKIATGTIANDKLANSSVTINNSAVSLGGSIELATGTDWQAVTVADGSTTLTTEAGKGYFLDTNAGIIEVFLPSSPARGDKVILADYSGTFATNQIIINTGGELLDSTAGNDFKVTTNNSIVELIYVDSAKGWLVKLNQAAGTTPTITGNEVSGIYDQDSSLITATGGTITTAGDYKIHSFTGDGCFVVTDGSGSLARAAYLVVAGGGGGGRDDGSGGGGGGYRYGDGCTNYIEFSPGTYPVVVGGGGAAGTAGCYSGKGSDSIVSTITSAGGGGGSAGNATTPDPSMSGGSGGGIGGAGPPSPPAAVVGVGNTPPVSPPQGFPGGSGACKHNTGGSGGGATEAGSDAPPAAGPGTANGRAGPGGAGSSVQVAIFGCAPQPYYPVMPGNYPGPDDTFSGGGGGSANAAHGSGGIGGGGTGRNAGSPTGVGEPGAANHGGGAGGGSNYSGPRCGGAGGRGIVLIRYKFQ